MGIMRLRNLCYSPLNILLDVFYQANKKKCGGHVVLDTVLIPTILIILKSATGIKSGCKVLTFGHSNPQKHQPYSKA